jgi:hypothetical protein
LVVAHLVLNVAAIPLIMTDSPLPSGELSDVFLWALFLLAPSQATLLALWVALGGGRFLWRVVPAVLGVILYLWWFGRANDEWRMIIFGQFCVSGLLLLVARVMGLELVLSSAPRTTSRPFQFSVRDMLMWTTALAVILSLLRCLGRTWLTSMRVWNNGESVAVFGSLALVTDAALYCSLGGRWLLARILLVPLAIGLAAYWLKVAVHSMFSARHLALLFGAMAAWLLGSLCLARLAGYRLAWRWPFSRNDLHAQPPDRDGPRESTETPAGDPA